MSSGWTRNSPCLVSLGVAYNQVAVQSNLYTTFYDEVCEVQREATCRDVVAFDLI
jgi:hypothetical protein